MVVDRRYCLQLFLVPVRCLAGWLFVKEAEGGVSHSEGLPVSAPVSRPLVSRPCAVSRGDSHSLLGAPWRVDPFAGRVPSPGLPGTAACVCPGVTSLCPTQILSRQGRRFVPVTLFQNKRLLFLALGSLSSVTVLSISSWFEYHLTSVCMNLLFSCIE